MKPPEILWNAWNTFGYLLKLSKKSLNPSNLPNRPSAHIRIVDVKSKSLDAYLRLKHGQSLWSPYKKAPLRASKVPVAHLKASEVTYRTRNSSETLWNALNTYWHVLKLLFQNLGKFTWRPVKPPKIFRNWLKYHKIASKIFLNMYYPKICQDLQNPQKFLNVSKSPEAHQNACIKP